MAIPLHARTRMSMGPALGRAPVPVTAIVIAAIVHGALAAAVIIGAGVWSARQPKTYVINLVPAIAATGTPEGRPAPVPPPRPNQVVSRTPPRPPDLPARDAPSPQMPAREAPPTSSLPDRAMPAREAPLTSSLPDRAMPARAPALPRTGDKELPTVPSTTSTKPVPAPTPVAPPPREVAAAPAPTPPPPGRPSGSALGSGAVTLNVSDFPFAWYLSAIHRKVTEQWSARALEGRQPVAVFEIGRNGQVSKLSIEKSSGNPYYDQAALRAITGANPFPPLPEEFKEPFLRVHLGFSFASERG